MRILVIEDEIKIAKLIKKRFEIEGFEVETAHEGDEGLNKAKSGSYNLIILDLMLPKIDGFEICKSLRNDDNKTPIIMLTARGTDEDKIAGLNAGANDFITKPFSFEELLVRAKSLLNEKKETFSKREIMKARSNPGRRAEDIINRKMQNLHQRILDSIPVSIITIDKEGNMTSVNKFYEKISRSGVCHYHNIFNNNFFIRENLVKDYKKLLAEGVPFERGNCYERNSNGEEKYLKICAVPLFDEEGNIEGALSMATDNTEAITFNKKLKELNKELEDRIQKRTIELDKLNNELNKVLEIKSSFMSDISHEMRTSLAVIQGNTEIIKSELNKEKTGNNEEFDQIYDEIKRMSSMLSDMSLLAKASESKQDMVFEEVDLNEIILNACKSLKILADEKKIDIRFNNKFGKLLIFGNQNQLEKLIFNLIKNAIKYNNNEGWIKIKIEKNDTDITLEIQDSGIGIAQKHLPFIFERFYRAEKSRSRAKGGTGLGLAICKLVVQSHGGSIDVHSEVNEGSIFTVKLPVGNQKAILDKINA